MIELVDINEQSFESMEELRAVIADQNRKEYVISSRIISLDEDGLFHAGKFEGRLTKPALRGLFNTLEIDEHYGLKACPPDLLKTSVRRLAEEKNTPLRVQTIDGVATAIMPSDRQPIRHDLLIDCLGIEQPIQEATLGINNLRIITVCQESEAFLPGDSFGLGWELLNSEDGWHSSTAYQFLLRMICVNGMVGFDKTASFSRSYNSRKPVSESMLKLVNIVENTMELLELESAIKWAADTPLGNQKEMVVSYISKQLEGEVTKRALKKEVTNDTSFYDFMNKITSLARIHRLDMRRKYEFEGGLLLRWFMSQGRRRPPWKKALCDSCDTWRHN